MIVHVNTFGLFGIKGLYVDAEINISKGIQSFEIIGMGNLAVKEATGRIKPAIENMGYKFPSGKITVNLAPASIKKEGSYFDLAIAIGILKSMEYIKWSIAKYAFIGELSLDGYIRPVKGVLPMIQAAIDMGINKFVVPVENVEEASLIEGCKIYPVSTIMDVVMVINENKMPWKKENEEEFEREAYGDFSDVKGQKQAVRAAEICAAGGHNIIMIGYIVTVLYFTTYIPPFSLYLFV